MAFLNTREKEILAVVCEALVPALQAEVDEDEALFKADAADVNLPDVLEQALEEATRPSEQFQLRVVLWALNNGAFNGLVAGHWAPLKDMPQPAREQVLYRLATSRLETLRTAFLSFKRLAAFLFYGLRPDDAPNPTWRAMGYSTPPPPPPEPAPIQPLVVDVPQTLETEVLVIGSGAGGGVVAAELAQAGHDVMIVEKGDYYPDHAFPRSELDGMQALYERKGALVTEDTSLAILAGSTLGGGTVVNWSTSLRLPDHVAKEWAYVMGFTGADSPEMADAFDAVTARINVGTDESVPNPNNLVLARGAAKLGYDVTTLPRNVKGCEVCDFCNYGCQFGAKQSTLKTYLQDAHDVGTRVLVRAEVDRVLHQNDTVRGAIVTTRDKDGGVHNVTVKAKVVVVSAGAVHTPAILLRSGLTNPNIGANLHLHPTTVTTGLFDEQIDPWRGAPQSRAIMDFRDLDGAGYGVWLETAPAHPGINGLAQPWTSARQHKRMAQSLPNTANIIILARDRDSGRIKVDRHGQPIVAYRLSPYDAKHLMFGVKEALRIHVAAGAREIAAPQNDRPAFRPGENGSLDAFLSQVEARGLRPNDLALFSAHQMCSARIGGDPERGAVDPTGQSWEVKNLYVADGAALPTAPGVNPMIPIMAVSHYIAGHIRSHL